MSRGTQPVIPMTMISEDPKRPSKNDNKQGEWHWLVFANQCLEKKIKTTRLVFTYMSDSSILLGNMQAFFKKT